MSERRGVERALSNLFERKHGREPTDDKMQTGLVMVLESILGIEQGPGDTSDPASRSPRMDILEFPLVLVPGIQRYPLGPRWPQPLDVQLQDGAPVLWVALRENEVDVDLCVQIFPTGTGLDLTTWRLDNYVGTWIEESGTVRHTFAWGDVHRHEPEPDVPRDRKIDHEPA